MSWRSVPETSAPGQGHSQEPPPTVSQPAVAARPPPRPDDRGLPQHKTLAAASSNFCVGSATLQQIPAGHPRADGPSAKLPQQPIYSSPSELLSVRDMEPEESPGSLARAPSCFRRAGSNRRASTSKASADTASSPMRFSATGGLTSLAARGEDGLSVSSRRGSASQKPYHPPSYGTNGRYPSRKVHVPSSGKRSSDSGARSLRVKRLRTSTPSASRKAKLTGYLGSVPSEVRGTETHDPSASDARATLRHSRRPASVPVNAPLRPSPRPPVLSDLAAAAPMGQPR